MGSLLALSHAAIGLLLLMFARADEDARAQLVRFGAAAGGAMSVALFLARDSEIGWRTVSFSPDAAALGATAAGCAWILLAVYDEKRGDVLAACLVGVGSSSLILFATNGWIVPALLFWAVLSVAVLSLGIRRPGNGWPWIVIGLSVACLVSGLLWFAIDADTWELPQRIPTGARWVVLVAALLRAGVAPRLAIWGYVGSGAGVAIPLLVGSGFALVPFARGDGIEWAALGLIVWSLGLAVWATARKHADLALVGAWFGATMIAVALVVPGASARAGVAALLAGSVAVLWLESLGRAQPERGLLFAIVPTTAGFGALVGATTFAFQRAIDADAIVDAAPWYAMAALAPVVLGFGVALGAMYGRRLDPEHYSAIAVLSTWTLLAAAVILGLSPSAELGIGSLGGADSRAPWLHLIAVGAGVVAARVAVARATGRVDIGEVSGAVEPGIAPVPRSLERILPAAALALALLATGAVLWLTYRGLEVGFL
jgi:hypothetical protein